MNSKDLYKTHEQQWRDVAHKSEFVKDLQSCGSFRFPARCAVWRVLSKDWRRTGTQTSSLTSRWHFPPRSVFTLTCGISLHFTSLFWGCGGGGILYSVFPMNITIISQCIHVDSFRHFSQNYFFCGHPLVLVEGYYFGTPPSRSGMHLKENVWWHLVNLYKFQ